MKRNDKSSFVDVDRVMTLARAKYREADRVVFGEHSAENAWAPGLLPYKDSYVVGDFLQYFGPAFIRNAYMAILRRQPDTAGFSIYQQALLNGSLSRIEILGDLRWSPEGLKHAVHVDGLLAPVLVERWKKKKYIGKLVAAADRITRFTDEEKRTISSGNQTATDLYRLGGRVEALFQKIEDASHEQIDALDQLAEEVGGALELQRAMESKISGLSDRLVELTIGVRSLETKLTEVERNGAEKREELHRGQAELEDRLVDVVDKHGALSTAVGDIHARLADARQQLAAHGHWIGTRIQDRERKANRNSSRDAMYVSFEDRFRGAPELIRERMRPYLDLLSSTAGVRNGAGTVLDIGCGAGDWLDLLRERNIAAKGVDTNHIFIEKCQARGLEASLADGLKYLEACPDSSLAAITAMHIVEHIGFQKLVTILDECRRVLSPGGILILETPNPENLMVASKYFYFDPTHRNPIPPETLQWVVEARGFSNVKIERLTHARELSAPSLLAESIPGALSINQMLSMLHAAPDYAIIAENPGASA